MQDCFSKPLTGFWADVKKFSWPRLHQVWLTTVFLDATVKNPLTLAGNADQVRDGASSIQQCSKVPKSVWPTHLSTSYCIWKQTGCINNLQGGRRDGKFSFPERPEVNLHLQPKPLNRSLVSTNETVAIMKSLQHYIYHSHRHIMGLCYKFSFNTHTPNLVAHLAFKSAFSLCN